MDIESLRKEIHPEDRPEVENLLSILDETIAVLGAAEVPFLLMGGLATSVLGRGRRVTDIDIFVRDRDVEPPQSPVATAG